jgi:hypothetical protein
MKTLLRLLIVLAMLLGFGVTAPASAAAPVDDLTALARYFPVQTPLYASLRTDAAYIDTLDGLLASLLDRLPPGTVPPDTGIRIALDAALADLIPDGTVAATVHPWLGDVAALGVTSLEPNASNDPMFIVAAAIQDRAAAAAFLEEALARDLTSGILAPAREEGTYTVYRPTDSTNPTAILLGDDVLILSFMTDAVVLGVGAPSLAENEAFIDSVARLPGDAYDGLVYASGDAVAAARTSTVSATPNGVTLADAYTDSGLTVGLVVLDGRTLAMDIATDLDEAALAAAGMDITAAQPLDPAFLGYLPADAQFVVQSTDLASQFASQPESDRSEFVQGFQEAFGLDFEQDVLAWMNGDYAAYLSLDMAFFDRMAEEGLGPDVLDNLPLDFGVVIEATDPAAARALVAQLADRLPALIAESEVGEELTVSVTTEAIGDGQAAVLVVEPGTRDMLPLTLQVLVGEEFLVGANDAVLALGTRAAVTAALAPAEGLASSAAFSAAQPYLVDGAATLAYIAPEGVSALGESVLLLFLGIDTTSEFMADGSLPSPEEREAAQAAQSSQTQMMIQQLRPQISHFLAGFDSLTLSTASNPDGRAVLRGTITLNP